jgi:hypothetical protein
MNPTVLATRSLPVGSNFNAIGEIRSVAPD